VALDLGVLTAFIEVDDRQGQRTIMGMQQKLRQFASQTVPDVEIDADAGPLERAVDQALDVLKTITDADTVAQLDADVSKAEAQVTKLRGELAVLEKLDPAVDVTVTADIEKARANLDRAEARHKALAGARAELVVTADTGQAERAIDDVAEQAESGLGRAGVEGGRKLSAGVLTALTALPIAGTVVGIGAALGASILSGLQNEVRGDLLAARTGLDEATVARIGRAAGEAYAANFGTSIADNMDAARVAIQGGLLDPAATERDTQAVIESLSGVADILGEDIPRVATAAGQLIRTGLARNADDAFDVIVRGTQRGNNASEDWLDTLTEYPALFQRLGLDGATATGLISQGLANGARNSDLVADALKEFQIRATDGSTLSAEGFKMLGLAAEETTAKIAAGGDSAREGLDQVLDKLRGIEDPVKRNAAAVALFGTQAEDLGAALFALDVSTAVQGLGQVEGAAKGAVSALGDNAAGQIASAQRNIEVAADGIKGALASAFGPQIEQWATGVQENRAGVVRFLLDMANGAIDAGRALVDAAAAGTEAFGTFISDVGPAMLDTLGYIVGALDKIPGVDLSDAVEGLESASEALDRLGPMAESAADTMRTQLIENGLDPAQDALNRIGIDQETQARFHDTTVALANDIAQVGYNADGTRLQLTDFEAGVNTSTEAGRALDEQLRTTVTSLGEQLRAAAAAGEGTDSLTATFNANRDALVQQLIQLGYSREAALRLAEQYGAVPKLVQTAIETTGTQAAYAAIESHLRQLGRIPASISTTVFISELRRDAATAARGPVQPRAAGGAYAPGALLVGEDGPELLFPDTGGFVLRHRATLEALNAGAVRRTFPAELGAAAASPVTTAAAAAAAQRTAPLVHIERVYARDEAEVARRITASQRAALAVAGVYDL